MYGTGSLAEAVDTGDGGFGIKGQHSEVASTGDKGMRSMGKGAQDVPVVCNCGGGGEYMAYFVRDGCLCWMFLLWIHC